jgi:hypothetical protein
VGLNSSVLIVILVFGVLFSLLYASQSMAANYPPKGFKTLPRVGEDAAIDIAMNDLKEQIIPLQLDKYVETQRYFGSPVGLLFVHANGTVCAIEGNTIFQPCDPAPCDIVGGKEPVRGHLFYDIDGSWQDSSVGNCSSFLYAIDAESGEILSSQFEGADDIHCDVKPPGW